MSEAQEQYYDMRDEPSNEPPKIPCPVDHLTLYWVWHAYHPRPPCPKCGEELKDE